MGNEPAGDEPVGDGAVGGLPDRAEVTTRLDDLLADGHRPAVFLVSVDGYDDLVVRDADGAAAAVRETARRLDRLVRNSDVLGTSGPGTFILVGSGVEPSVAGSLVERIQGVAALPVDVAGEPVSLRVDIGLAFATTDCSGAALLDRAGQDLVRSRRAT